MKTIALLACLALCPAAAATGPRRASAACSTNLASQIAAADSATQLITVVAAQRGSTQGMLQVWKRSGGCWVSFAGPWPAWLGQRGISGNKREGDRTTPAGFFGFNHVMYGLAPNPGVRFPYHRIVCGDWWVEDPQSPYYNLFHHVRCGSKPPFRVTSEDMSKSPTAYRNLAVIDSNTNPIVPGRGSGIFLHVSRGHPTLGCISLPLPRLLRVLRWLNPASEPRIAIGTPTSIRGL
jgi:L,D-peptidoglycan transpeptidase YkuD (ErfK/YbiS/YcfS/YnhG family)